MREHAGFAAVVATCIAAIGAGLIGIGIAEAQSGAAGGPLDLWGNAWFVLGLCLVILGGGALIGSVVMYIRRPRGERQNRNAADAPVVQPVAAKGISPQRQRAILAAAAADAKARRIERLRRLHGDGRQLRTRIGAAGVRSAPLSPALSGDVARWEATVDAEFTGAPSIRDRFTEAPREDSFAVTAGGAHDRISYQLEYLEMIIRELEQEH